MKDIANWFFFLFYFSLFTLIQTGLNHLAFRLIKKREILIACITAVSLPAVALISFSTII